MRFTVTALGSAGDRPVGVVVGTIARYLIAPDQKPEASSRESPEHPTGDGSVSRYYADRGDSPGRWLGQGARELELKRTVALDEFTTLLAGRDPRTGARLISARGSSGRVASVGAGTAACWSAAGEARYSVRDAAAVLGWSQADVRQAIDKGEHLAASRFIKTLTETPFPARTGTPGTSAAPPGGDTGRDRDTGSGPWCSVATSTTNPSPPRPRSSRACRQRASEPPPRAVLAGRHAHGAGVPGEAGGDSASFA